MLPAGESSNPQQSPPPQPIHNHRRLSFMFAISILVFWIFIMLRDDVLTAMMFPLVFLPFAGYLLIWKFKRSRLSNEISAYNLVYAYAKGFWVFGPIGYIFNLFCLAVLASLLWSWDLSDGVALIFVLIYVVIGDALPSEYGKYRIVAKGRSERQDLNVISSYLWYAVSGAMGFSTFWCVANEFVFFYFSTNISFTLLDILIFVMMELPLHIATGYLLGIQVAHNECFKKNQSFWKIAQVPILLRSTAMLSYWLSDWFYPWWVVFIIYPLVFFTAVGIIIYQNQSLPQSFAPLASDEDGDRADQECGEAIELSDQVKDEIIHTK
jgi:hypothetical protein